LITLSVSDMVVFRSAWMFAMVANRLKYILWPHVTFNDSHKMRIDLNCKSFAMICILASFWHVGISTRIFCFWGYNVGLPNDGSPNDVWPNDVFA
jgi:hypothetical protein